MEDKLIEPNVIILHLAPVTPFEGNRWRTAINLEDLPRKCRHHPLECLMRGCKVGMSRAVELVRGDNGVVGTDLEHIFSGLRWPSVDGEGIISMIDSSPVR